MLKSPKRKTSRERKPRRGRDTQPGRDGGQPPDVSSLSSREELERANQALESSHEEMLALNEELQTVNSELDRKVAELATANSDLQNLLSATDVILLFLDREQRIAKYTPAAKAFFRLIETDIGRPLSDLAPRFGRLDLTAEARRAMLSPVEREIEATDGRSWYLLRVLPYRAVSGALAGTVVTLTDITRVKRGEAERERLVKELSEAQEELRAELEASKWLLWVGSLFLREGNLAQVLEEIVDAAIAISHADFGNIQLLSRESGDLEIAAYRGFPENWLHFWNHVQKGHGACGTALEHRQRIIVEDVEASPIFVGTPALEVQLEAGVRAVQSTPLFGRTGEPIGMLSTHFRTPTRPSDRALRLLDLLARQVADILDRARAEQALRLTAERLQSAVENIEDAFALFDAKDRLVLCNRAYRHFIGDAVEGDLVGKPFEELLEAYIADIEFPDEEARRRFRVERLTRRPEPTVTFDVRMRDGRRLRILDRRTAEGGSVKTIWDLTDDPRRAGG